MAASVTLSRKLARHVGDATARPHLFLITSCTPLDCAPARCSLDDIEEVVIGRSNARALVRDGAHLRIALPDAWMSAKHVILRRVLDAWSVEDAHSKNGTLVNGAAIDHAALDDGDLIEAGSTFFAFRKSIAAAKELPPIFDTDACRAKPLDTLLPSLAAEFSSLEKVARSPVVILLHGESGVGKEVVASTLHDISGRPGSFVAVNCAALPATLIESELFGYRRGAFSGANEDRLGLVRAAQRGSLFLDEIGDLPLPAQGALLRVLQQKEVLALGTTKPVKIDVRVITATHRDLDAWVIEKRFRKDLLARIRGFVVHLPPLRERREDLGLLILSLLQGKLEAGKRQVVLTNEVTRTLLLYDWPMNIRELEKCLETALVLAGDGPVELRHLPPEIRNSAPARPAPVRVTTELAPEDARMREELVSLLKKHEGNVTAVATALQKDRMQVYRWARRFGLRLSDFR